MVHMGDDGNIAEFFYHGKAIDQNERLYGKPSCILPLNTPFYRGCIPIWGIGQTPGTGVSSRSRSGPITNLPTFFGEFTRLATC